MGIASDEERILAPDKQIFIAEYLKHGGGKRAAITAGFNEAHASMIASRLVHKDPEVKKAIAEARALVKKEIGYSAVTAMRECENAMEFAMATDNANALVKAVELRSKLQGLLVDKVDIRMNANFSVNISGIERKKPIDVTPALPESDGMELLE